MNVISDLMGFAMSNVLYQLARDITDNDEINERNTCEIDPDSNDYPRDFKMGFYIMGGIFTAGSLLFIVLFRCPFLRKNADDGTLGKNASNNNNSGNNNLACVTNSA